MRDFKILIVLSVVIGILYIGVEPLAHYIMYPEKISPVDYTFKNITDKDMASLKPNISKGKEIFTNNCTACHSMKKSNIVAMDDMTASQSFGVNPPDLSIVGLIYSKNYLRAFIANPAKASLIENKFNHGKTHPMLSYDAIIGKQGIVDVVGYLQSISKGSTPTDKEVFLQACNRCHTLEYADIKLGGDSKSIYNYLGTKTPDLSQVIRSKGEDYLITFINNPQQHLPGTRMPSVGLNKYGTDKVIRYLEKTGDSSKGERDSLGWKVILFFIILGILAYLWKKEVWRELH